MKLFASTLKKASKKVENKLRRGMWRCWVCRRPLKKGECGVQWARKWGKDPRKQIENFFFEACDSVVCVGIDVFFI
jgi:hypothetical protein